mmetsp:Transcript_15181/g.33041  ORF Transcript_15181/g.33041 Transcript_15181/m.33041 type:complete len:446 (-) Transcript_15181:108-1445(-)
MRYLRNGPTRTMLICHLLTIEPFGTRRGILPSPLIRRCQESKKKEVKSPPLTEQSQVTKPCPKVYIYDTASSHRAKKRDKVFGEIKKELNRYHRHTDQFSFALILEYRLRRSSQCYTADPDEADLFYVPLHTKPKKHSEWVKTCVSSEKSNITALLERLHHLNPATACRHFFVVSKGHYVSRNCSGTWYRPVPQLRNTLRLAYSHLDFIRDTKDGGNTTSHLRADEKTRSEYPNLFSVPYPSSVHYSSKIDTSQYPPPWRQSTGRDILMLFLGSTSHGDTEVRQRIAQQCNSYNNASVCISYNPRSGTKNGATYDLSTKGRSVFCLEPAGDSPYRKSLSDSITYGCIPVLFSNLTNEVAPWHWEKWREAGRVLVPRDAFTTGVIDLKVLLESIPSRLLTLMQATVRQNARGFQYSLEDDDYDGIRITLDGLQNQATKMEGEGICR